MKKLLFLQTQILCGPYLHLSWSFTCLKTQKLSEICQIPGSKICQGFYFCSKEPIRNKNRRFLRRRQVETPTFTRDFIVRRIMAQILVVEDDPMVQETITDALMMFGHTIITAENGMQALQRFDRDYYDVAVVDVEMPQMNGFAFTRAVKNIQPDFPVILITGYSHLYRPQDVLSLDVEAFLKKPLNLQELLRIVEGILIRRQSAGERD